MSLRYATSRIISLFMRRGALAWRGHGHCVSNKHAMSHNSRAFIHQSRALRFPKIVPYFLSDIGEGIVEVVIKEWFVKPGDKIAQFDPVCEVQSDKASVTITSRYDGHIQRIHYNVDDVAKVGQPLLDIAVSDDVTTGAAEAPVSAEEVSIEITKPAVTTPPTTPDMFHTDKALATPAVRKMAKENQLDLSKVPATGKAGRVLKEDVINYISTNAKSNVNSTAQETTPPPQTHSGDRVEELVGMKKAMFKTMTDAWRIPHLTLGDEMDVTDLLAFRKEARLDEKAGTKVTNLPFLMKALSLALLRYPALNSHMDESGPRLKIIQDINVGVAVDTPQGLIVPVVKSVQKRSVIQIAKELSRLQLLASQNKLGVEDLSGGTITLSNIGAIGGTHASPILLPPQVVIGAITKIQRLPRYNKTGELTPRDLLTVSWAADHRAVDGATVARFSNLIKLYIASPNLLFNL